jgi:aspartate/methionine/tyrosine aminotransferase
VEPRLAAFDLERWLRAHEPAAKHAIGGSGAPRASLAPFLPGSPEEWGRLWSQPADDATRALREAVASQYAVAAAEVVPTQGASEADFLAALALAGPRAHVVVEEPAYFALLEPARALGCRVTRVPRGPEQAFRLDPGAVERAMSPATRLVCTAQPHNPSGDRGRDAELVEVAEACARRGAWLLCDEVFADATGPARPARLLHERILTTNSLTKCLGFGPLHVGWLVAPPDALESLDRGKAHTTVNNPVLDLALGARVLAQRPRLLEVAAAARAANLPLVEAFAQQHGLRWHRPERGTTCVVRLPDAWRDDAGFARALLKREGTLVAPGSFLELPGWVRLGLLAPPAAMRGGARRDGAGAGRLALLPAFNSAI